MTQAIFGTELHALRPPAFNRLVERLLWHLSFGEVSNIDGAGDGGADLVGVRDGQRWVFQAKSKKSTLVESSAVDELRQGLQIYDGDRGAVVSNGRFSRSAQDRAQQLERATGLKLGLWGGKELAELFNDPQCANRFSTPDLRPYQVEAFQAARYDLERRNSAFLVLATGLGKTVIAGTVIDWFLSRHPESQVLVLAHTRDLVDQLERALWRHLPKNLPTQQLQGSEKPEALPGVTVATVQTAVTYVRQGFRPDFIFIDEAHHTGEGTLFAEILNLCPDAMRLGATATPWRGDEFDVSTFFGEPSYKIGIEEGMRLGYLVDVDYRLYVDNVDWDFVAQASQNSYSVAELNQKLFLPQRDERIRDELLDVWMRTTSPRAIVFCQTIDHAEHLLGILQGVPAWRKAAALHDRMSKREQKTNLSRFRLGDVPLLVAVDILNEGVDIPDVNIVCFARITHSRRIFIQQLGRGLRLSPGKTHVSVLDFVSDLKRVKAALDLRSQVTREIETLVLPSSHSITFNDPESEAFLTKWLFDAANLETAADEARLNFPPSHGV
jgi:superfamily II DNA or RNA helicase